MDIDVPRKEARVALVSHVEDRRKQCLDIGLPD